MKVEWWESPPIHFMFEDDLLPPIKRCGEIVGARGSIFGGTILVVALEDGRIVNVPSDRCRRLES